jgi:iron complex outermembrane recepter protein
MTVRLVRRAAGARPSPRWSGPLILVAVSVLHSTAANAAEPATSLTALKGLSLDELLDVEVTSVSRRPEKLLQAPAAVQVIVNEAIRRSGATDLPSVLRLANNLDVAQENGHEWVISARGFSSDVGNKLLVMMDGRSVYTPLFSGVFWDRQDYVLEDIDRIEIVSGPGGAVWGANAVNGVINITTRSARDTQGLFVNASGGTNPQSLAEIRYGGELGDDGAFRVYGKFFDYDHDSLEQGGTARDAWRKSQLGFRFDTSGSERDALTLQGDAYTIDEQLQSGGSGTVNGGNVLGRWTRSFSGTSDMSLQFYYDRTHLTLPVPAAFFAPAGTLRDDLDTYDLDFQHRFALGSRQVVVWGLGYRFTHDNVENAPALGFFPEKLDQNLYSAFVQDEISLREDLALTLGTKLEHTDYTGFEYEPSIRLQWDATQRHSLWAAVSRAVRTPSRIDRDISQPIPGYLIVILEGGERFRSEELLAYELGVRGQLGSRVTASLSTFYNEYDELRSTSISPPDPIFGLPFPFFFENNLEGTTWGFELSADAQLLERWRLHAAYRLLQEDLRVVPGKFDFNNTLNETADPEQQAQLRSSLDLPGNLALDATFRWVDNRIANNSGVPALVPAYTELDVRLAWRPTPAVELSLAGRNLLHSEHVEYGVPGPARVALRRQVYGSVTWRH